MKAESEEASSFPLLLPLFETGSHSVVLAVLELTLYTKMNSFHRDPLAPASCVLD